MEKESNINFMKFESNVQKIKYDVIKSVAEYSLSGTLKDNFYKIPKKIIKGPEPTLRCCIYKERAIIEERVVMAMGGDEEHNKLIEVLEIACDECPVDAYKVTESCRGCVAHKCLEVCPFGAIEIINTRAVINKDKCRECGKCKAACPFEAIAYIQRPCIRSCNAGALSIDENKKAKIDDNKCISCGACVSNCPFGAIMDKSYVVNVIEMIKESRKNGNKVYAIIAPAIASQFTYAKIGQIVTAIKKLGFHHVIEAALGADIVAINETHDFKDEIEDLKFITSSCCPAFVQYIKKNYKELEEHISKSVSPMIAAARLIKNTDPTAKTVFIGPCIAKKAEIEEEDLKGSCDYVITFEELLSYLDAAGIYVGNQEESPLDNASFFGRIFARSGGLTEAIKEVIKEENIEVEYKPIICNGLKECDTSLKLAKFKRLTGNFIEGMACSGGCIGGPGTITRGPRNRADVDKYGNLAIEKKISDSLRIFNIDKIKLTRK